MRLVAVGRAPLFIDGSAKIQFRAEQLPIG